MEIAIANDWIVFEWDGEKPTGHHFDTPEHKALVQRANVCRIGYHEGCGQCLALEKKEKA